MLSGLVHFTIAVVLAVSLYFAVQHYKLLKHADVDVNDVNTESTFESVKNVTTEHVPSPPEEELFEPDIDVTYIIPEDQLPNTVIEERFVIRELIARGHIAAVWDGYDQATKTDVAIKLAQPGVRSEVLEAEYQNYLKLNGESKKASKFGLPQVLYFGDFGGYKVLILKKLGLNLRDLKESVTGNKFNLDTVIKIATQMMPILEKVHSRGLLVSDLRSTSMAIGSTEETLNKIFLYDLASCVEISEDAQPIHDLITLGFVLLELNGVKFPPIKGAEEIKDVDAIIDFLLQQWNKKYIKDLCAQSDDADLFYSYLKYLYTLKTEVNYNDLSEFFFESLSADGAKVEGLGIF